ncbi:MAG: FkbM family methyltransferase [Clostridia bacterium]|nr:FkbM family methyltransferase [Clostridia bacterium]
MERDLWQYLKTAQKPIVLYGMGNGADKIIKVLEQKGISYSGIFASDGFVRNKLFHGMPIESYSALKERFGDMIVLLCFGTHLLQVIDNIKKIAKEQELYAPEVPVIGDRLFDFHYYCENKADFDSIYSLLADEQSRLTFSNTVKYKLSGKIDYLFNCETSFDEPFQNILASNSKERVLDLGAYNGDTALDFADRFPFYEKIIAVEPDKKTFKKLAENTKGLKIDCFNICISDFTGTGEFSMNGGRNSSVGEGTQTEFSTVDDLLKGERVSIIKMDVEGEEKRAIKGAEKTILAHRPKMIISAYHRTEDFFEIPKTVLSIRKDYKIYMRHFPSLPAWDTVYYFI